MDFNKNKKKLLFVFGTRPEAIKLAPLIKKLETHPKFKVVICITAQHRYMLDQVLTFFKIKADYDLNIMTPDQTLFDIKINVLGALKNILNLEKPDLLIVQGDTTTTMAAALAGFYSNTKIAHIEAGLRSGNIRSPYPEEANRIITGHIANYHFVPTILNSKNLNKENIKKNIYIVGNTVIDALFLGLDIIKEIGEKHYYTYFKQVDFSKKIVMITNHRRENFGAPMQNIFEALRDLALYYKNIQFVFAVHPNPNVTKLVQKILLGIDNILLLPPLEYAHTIWLMQKSYIIITDSGGIQEEAPSLNKPILVTREVTERTEGIKAGTAKLVGSKQIKITREVKKLLNNEAYYTKMSSGVNPYGDGKASEYIIKILENELF